MAQRGKVSEIYSDNATNFKGAANELNNVYKFFKNEQTKTELLEWISNLEINWHFIQPSFPHFGCIWEVGIKAVKFHLK